MISVAEEFNEHSGSLTDWYLASGSYGLEVLYDQPLAFWRLSETSGTVAAGQSSNYVDGAYAGGYTQGVTGPLTDRLSATLFNGSSGYIDLSAFMASIEPTVAFSLECWFKTSTDSKTIFGANTKGISLFMNGSNKLTGRFNNGTSNSSVTSALTVTDNVYHHAVLTYDGATLTLYLDGASNGTPTAVATTVSYAGVTAISIGATGGASAFFSGQIADVAIYDTALSAARVAIHHAVGIGTASTTALTPALSDHHYDLRTLNNANQNVPYSQNDLGYWNAAYFNGMTALQMNTGTVISSANETWSGGTIAQNSSWRYQSYLSQAVTTGTSPLSFDSTITDDISTDFTGGTWYIEGQLRAFPAQAATNHFNLAASFVDFSSDASYAGGSTDSLALSASLVNLTPGGDIAFRFNRTSLVNTSLTSVKHVRLRFTSIGGGTATFQMQSIRVYPSTKVWNTIDLDTRKGCLVRQLPQNGVEWTKDYPPMYTTQTQIKNFVYWVKFNSGHSPVKTTGSNKLSLLCRYNPTTGTFIKVKLTSNQTESRIRIFENFTEIASTAAASNILTNSTDYLLKVETNGDQLKASIYTAVGVFASTLIYTTGWQTISAQFAGCMGLWFQPFNYDFVVHYMRSGRASVGGIEGVAFSTRTPVRAITLNPKSSAPEDLLDGQPFGVTGDAIGGDSFGLLARTGTTWYGGIESESYIYISNPDPIRIALDILPKAVNGFYRVYLKNQDGLVAYLNTLSSPTPNIVNSYDLSVNGSFIPGFYKVGFQEAGFVTDSFQILNVHIYQPTFTWEGSVDGGENWYPFRTALGTKYSNLNLPLPGSLVKIRGSKVSETGWVSNWEWKPIYGYPGQS